MVVCCPGMTEVLGLGPAYGYLPFEDCFLTSPLPHKQIKSFWQRLGRTVSNYFYPTSLEGGGGGGSNV